jgi:histidinol-phosphatase (PHP family)
MNNYHTHTFLCRHAEGSVTDYAMAAVEAGLTELGMSDHTPLPDGRWDWVRMDMSELEKYESQIRDARKAIPELTILKGMECDWSPEYFHFFQEELLGERKYEYLIGAVHWYRYRGDWLSLGETENPRQLKAYTEYLIGAMESGLFSFIAHPDAFGSGYTSRDEDSRACSRDILDAAAALDIPLEINGYGFRKSEKLGLPPDQRLYPLKDFWELAAEYPVRAICNSDAHTPGDVAASIQDGRELAARFDVPLVETLDCPVSERCR